MSRIDQIGEVLISEEEIIKRAKELGEKITMDHENDDVILVGILRGAVMWMTELMKHIKLDLTIDFMVCSSYGSSTKTSGVVKIDKDLNSDIHGKSVIIVEDIVDSGVTLSYLILPGAIQKALRYVRCWINHPEDARILNLIITDLLLMTGL